MTEFVDVVIVGAGISGISAAWHLQDRCPDKSYVILERREDLGGTWDLFKYPGLRSDSDLFTFGFRFKPWTSARVIADGPAIKAYIAEAATENGIDKHIRYRNEVCSADWSDEDHRWTLTVRRDGQESTISCTFLFACSGYYNFDEGYTPEFPGAEDFGGTVVHPQHWPEDLDYTDKKVVVIGSGATAVTLIPALADTGVGHVTMLQRSPTYVAGLPAVDALAAQTNRWLPAKAAHFVNRWRAVGFQAAQYQAARRFPSYFRKVLKTMATRRLPKGYDYDTHFNPSYKPWDQRLCLAPDGDFFKTIRSGKADVVTDTIERFTKTGILLGSGQELPADIIVTATGLNVRLFGGATVSRNGVPVALAERMTYKAMMLSDIPNMAFTIGYTNASWTLKADLVSEYVCRLLNYMDKHGYDTVVAEHPGAEVDVLPFTDFSPGYFQRVLHELPKAGSHGPWKAKQNYFFDLRAIRYGKVDDDALVFTKHTATVPISA